MCVCNAPSFTLDGLDEERCDVLAVQLESALEVGDFAIPDRFQDAVVEVAGADAFEVRSEAGSTFRVRAHAAKRVK